MNSSARRRAIPVRIGNVTLGGDAPIVVQSMTNTDTADIEATTAQVAALARAGSELVRVTVDRAEAAAAVPYIRERLDILGLDAPLIGDFHYNGHTLLKEHPACAEALAKYRINPGNVGFKDKRDRQFAEIIEIALQHGKPVRIGVNWGSLDQDLLTRLMDENAALPEPKDAREVMHEAIVQSALLSAERAIELGLGPDRIVLSAKVSAVQDLIAVYAMLAARSESRAASRADRSRHGIEGHRRVFGRARRAAAAGHRRHHPHLADAGAERRPHARGEGGAGAVAEHGLPRLRAAGRRLPRLRAHHVHHLPGTRPRHPGFHSRTRCRSGSAAIRGWRRSPSR